MARKTLRKGTDNVLVELWFDDAEELSAKAILAVKLNKLIDAQALSQAAAAEILAMPQPKISAISNYKLQGISLERHHARADGPRAAGGDRSDTISPRHSGGHHGRCLTGTACLKIRSRTSNLPG